MNMIIAITRSFVIRYLDLRLPGIRPRSMPKNDSELLSRAFSSGETDELRAYREGLASRLRRHPYWARGHLEYGRVGCILGEFESVANSIEAVRKLSADAAMIDQVDALSNILYKWQGQRAEMQP